jgi:hypothetical protein
MKKLTVILAVVLLGACSGGRVKKYLPDDYSGWEKTTNTVLNYPISGHENHFRIPYINETGEKPEITVKNNRKYYNYPPGTIIIKEVYDKLTAPAPGEKPIMLTAMVKTPDDPNALGGWVWIVKTPQNKEIIFKSDFCITCHNDANSAHPYGDKNPDGEFRDYVFFPYHYQSREESEK